MTTFVDPKAQVEIKLDEENVVWVRARMDLRTQAAIERELLQMRIDTNELGNGRSSMPSLDVVFSLTAQKMVLLKHNLKKWRGPLFVDERGRPVACSPEMIERLDPEENLWWIDLVAERVGELNKAKTAVPENGAPEGVADDPN